MINQNIDQHYRNIDQHLFHHGIYCRLMGYYETLDFVDGDTLFLVKNNITHLQAVIQTLRSWYVDILVTVKKKVY